jgi:membrane protein YdbS with pleckstrin-like domain
VPAGHNGGMTQPIGLGGRPHTPAPGAPTPELKIARVRRHARRLFWPAVVLVAVAGATGYFFGNLPAPFRDWMLVTVAAVAVFFLVLLPFVAWWSHTYTITTRRVIERRGVLRTQRRDLSHAPGYAIRVRRGLLQRMWGAGTLTLTGGVDEPLRMVDIPNAALVHEVLVDQVEVSQILAHRDAQSVAIPIIPPMPPAPGVR